MTAPLGQHALAPSLPPPPPDGEEAVRKRDSERDPEREESCLAAAHSNLHEQGTVTRERGKEKSRSEGRGVGEVCVWGGVKRGGGPGPLVLPPLTPLSTKKEKM